MYAHRVCLETERHPRKLGRSRGALTEQRRKTCSRCGAAWSKGHRCGKEALHFPIESAAPMQISPPHLDVCLGAGRDDDGAVCWCSCLPPIGRRFRLGRPFPFGTGAPNSRKLPRRPERSRGTFLNGAASILLTVPLEPAGSAAPRKISPLRAYGSPVERTWEMGTVAPVDHRGWDSVRRPKPLSVHHGLVRVAWRHFVPKPLRRSAP